DESVMTPEDAVAHGTSATGYGTFVIKLMKCGGITSAQAIAATAAQANIELMWGCMDESVIGISAALHTAFACEQTRYLDLDGSLDLLEDVATGGFELVDGMMRTLDRPGLGADLRDNLHTLT
ncbi:MAG: L-alanine-DL-glutamate epimerase-like enolase superfamily enzyme, partial [Planctomycetota bacterium]